MRGAWFDAEGRSWGLFMNILLTSVGRRVKIVEFFKHALKGEGAVFAGDCSTTAPGLYAADKGFILPEVKAVSYLTSIMDICRQHQISAVIPLIDSELPVLAGAVDDFLRQGIRLIVACPKTVFIGQDKLLTAQLFSAMGVPTPKTWGFEDGLDQWDYPVIIKPQNGSASNGVYLCQNLKDVMFYKEKVVEPIIQEYVEGREVTYDVLCDFQSRCLSIVGRQRLKVRAGEVERGMTVRCHGKVKKHILNIVKVLKPIGVINIQCFLTDNGPLFIEINPRFGGGYPLAQAVGANFPKKLIKLLKGELWDYSDDWREGMLMLRYDEAVFIKEENLYGEN